MYKAYFGSLRRRAQRIRARIGQLRVVPADTGPIKYGPDPQVAVIVPIFNALPHLHELLDSLAGQDLDSTRFELILVDDGSTDGSARVLDEFVRRQPNSRLIRQRNSGWPGQPRNLGLRAATAAYVFFADADDVLAPEALRSMLDFAQEHHSDIVLPRMAGLNGRRVNRTLYGQSVVDAGLRTVFATLSPQKLIRRRLLEEHGLRFPEGRVRLEDGMLVSRAYLAAGRISILAEKDYYFLRSRPDGQNISARRSDPVHYTRSVGTIAGYIRNGCPDPQLADQLVLDLYRRKILRSYLPTRYQSMSARRRRRTIHAHHGFLAEQLPVHLEQQLPYPFRQRSERLRAADPAGLLDLAATELVLAGPWQARTSGDRLHFTADGSVPDAARMILRARDGSGELGWNLRHGRQGFSLAVVGLPLHDAAGRVHDVYLQPTHRGITGPPVRVRTSPEQLSGQLRQSAFYATGGGYLSLDLRAGTN